MQNLLSMVIRMIAMPSLAVAQTLLVLSPIAVESVNANTYSLFSADSAKGLVQTAVSAMGGEERLQAIKALKLKGDGHTYLLEQSERPEGPWIVTYEEIAELHDLERRMLRQTVSTRGRRTG